MCCFILRRGDTQTVAADAGLPRAWRTALANPSVIPFEVWRTGLISGFATGSGMAHTHGGSRGIRATIYRVAPDRQSWLAARASY